MVLNFTVDSPRRRENKGFLYISSDYVFGFPKRLTEIGNQPQRSKNQGSSQESSGTCVFENRDQLAVIYAKATTGGWIRDIWFLGRHLEEEAEHFYPCAEDVARLQYTIGGKYILFKPEPLDRMSKTID